MSRGKKRRKALLKAKRLSNTKKGRLVRFDLQNCGRRLHGMNNKYCYQTNIHNLKYCGANFYNVKYESSNITKCNFKNANFKGVDFCNCNLKGTVFSKAVFENVLFVNCNLKGSNFANAKFKNVYFISTNIDVSKNMILDENAIVLKTYPSTLCISSQMKECLHRLGKINKIYKYHVIHVKPTKPNRWIIKILLDKYGNDVGRAFNALVYRRDKRGFYTLNSYMQFIESYLKL